MNTGRFTVPLLRRGGIGDEFTVGDVIDPKFISPSMLSSKDGTLKVTCRVDCNGNFEGWDLSTVCDPVKLASPNCQLPKTGTCNPRERVAVTAGLYNCNIPATKNEILFYEGLYFKVLITGATSIPGSYTSPAEYTQGYANYVELVNNT